MNGPTSRSSPAVSRMGSGNEMAMLCGQSLAAGSVRTRTCSQRAERLPAATAMISTPTAKGRLAQANQNPSPPD